VVCAPRDPHTRTEVAPRIAAKARAVRQERCQNWRWLEREISFSMVIRMFQCVVILGEARVESRLSLSGIRIRDKSVSFRRLSRV